MNDIKICPLCNSCNIIEINVDCGEWDEFVNKCLNCKTLFKCDEILEIVKYGIGV